MFLSFCLQMIVMNIPSSCSNNDPIFYSPASLSSFQELCQFAVENERPLHLQCDITLNETIVLRKRQHLYITSDHINKKFTISGDLHSLFLLNNHSSLTLKRINLNHSLESEDHRKVGAAVNLRYKSSLNIFSCSIHSKSGFCCWAVQKTFLNLEDCELTAWIRSPVVCFGQPTCTLTRVIISNAGVHAICARGLCTLRLNHCTIKNSAARAVYAYANASVEMKHCHISHTKRPDKAAIEVSAAGGGGNNNDDTQTKNQSKLVLKDCLVVDNQGIGVLLRGNVLFEMEENCILEGNYSGDLVKTDSLQDDDEAVKSAIIKRDASCSSFRQGDWWCPKKKNCCNKKIVIGGNEKCPDCQSPFRKKYLLTTTQIHHLNQGTFDVTKKLVEWQFDADEQGWLPFDDASNRQLEEAFREKNSKNQQNQQIVLIQNGKYQVDLVKMEQTNVISQMLRLVRRIESTSSPSLN
jgi:hypothetical protein